MAWRLGGLGRPQTVPGTAPTASGRWARRYPYPRSAVGRVAGRGLYNPPGALGVPPCVAWAVRERAAEPCAPWRPCSLAESPQMLQNPDPSHQVFLHRKQTCRGGGESNRPGLSRPPAATTGPALRSRCRWRVLALPGLAPASAVGPPFGGTSVNPSAINCARDSPSPRPCGDRDRGAPPGSPPAEVRPGRLSGGSPQAE